MILDSELHCSPLPSSLCRVLLSFQRHKEGRTLHLPSNSLLLPQNHVALYYYYTLPLGSQPPPSVGLPACSALNGNAVRHQQPERAGRGHYQGSTPPCCPHSLHHLTPPDDCAARRSCVRREKRSFPARCFSFSLPFLLFLSSALFSTSPAFSPIISILMHSTTHTHAAAACALRLGAAPPLMRMHWRRSIATAQLPQCSIGLHFLSLSPLFRVACPPPNTCVTFLFLFQCPRRRSAAICCITAAQSTLYSSKRLESNTLPLSPAPPPCRVAAASSSTVPGGAAGGAGAAAGAAADMPEGSASTSAPGSAPSARVGRFRRRAAAATQEALVRCGSRTKAAGTAVPFASGRRERSKPRVVSAALSQPHPPTEKTAEASVLSASMSWSYHPAQVAKTAACALRAADGRAPTPHVTCAMLLFLLFPVAASKLQLSPKLLSLCKEEVCDI